MKPAVCVKCELFYKPKKTGVYFEEGAPTIGDEWGPYKLWASDLHECAGCGSQILIGMPVHAIAHDHERDYAERVALFVPMFRVDDC